MLSNILTKSRRVSKLLLNNNMKKFSPILSLSLQYSSTPEETGITELGISNPKLVHII